MNRSVPRVAVLLAFLLAVQADSAEYGHPFWAEKSSFVEGDVLYAVGVATQAKSQEAGRQTAYESGKRELSNFAQITDLSGLNIETQMTYEELNRDGTFNVFRLLKVDMGELTRWKAKLLAQATAQMESQNQEVSREIARKKVQVEMLERQTAELADLDARAASVRNRVLDLNQKVDKHMLCGMTLEEVRSLLGPPRAVHEIELPGNIAGQDVALNYGDRWLWFRHGILNRVSRTFSGKGRCSE